MEIGDKSRNISGQGIKNTIQSVNILRNQNYAPTHFLTSFSQNGVNIALANPYKAKVASFYSSKSWEPSEFSSQEIAFTSEQRDYTFDFDNDDTEEDRKIINMPAGGKFLIVFFVTGRYHRTGDAPDDQRFLQLSAQLTSSGSSVSDAVAYVTIFVPGKHLINAPLGSDDFVTDIDGGGNPIYSETTLLHLPVDFVHESFYDQGCASAIIDVDDLNSDHELQLSVNTSMVSGEDFFISAAGTGMTIIGPLSFGVNEND